jgi:hypothetical protein
VIHTIGELGKRFIGLVTKGRKVVSKLVIMENRNPEHRVHKLRESTVIVTDSVFQRFYSVRCNKMHENVGHGDPLEGTKVSRLFLRHTIFLNAY